MKRFMLTILIILSFLNFSEASSSVLNGTSQWKKIHIPLGQEDEHYDVIWQASSLSPYIVLLERCHNKIFCHKRNFKIVSIETGNIAELTLEPRWSGDDPRVQFLEDIPGCGCFVFQYISDPGGGEIFLLIRPMSLITKQRPS